MDRKSSTLVIIIIPHHSIYAQGMLPNLNDLNGSFVRSSWFVFARKNWRGCHTWFIQSLWNEWLNEICIMIFCVQADGSQSVNSSFECYILDIFIPILSKKTLRKWKQHVCVCTGACVRVHVKSAIIGQFSLVHHRGYDPTRTCSSFIQTRTPTPAHFNSESTKVYLCARTRAQTECSTT